MSSNGRDTLNGLLCLVGDLALKLTGKVPVVTFYGEDGLPQPQAIYSEHMLNRVSWIAPEEADAFRKHWETIQRNLRWTEHLKEERAKKVASIVRFLNNDKMEKVVDELLALEGSFQKKLEEMLGVAKPDAVSVKPSTDVSNDPPRFL